MNNVVPALSDINIPRHVKVETTTSFESLMSEIGRRSMMGYAGETFFGTAFVQGSRLQFTTAMPVQKMVQVSKTDRSKKKAGLEEVTEHSNRPQEPGHAKAVRNYLMSTACTGDKFILPAFTFNYGVGLDDDSPVATIILFASGDDGTNAWPAILLLPQGAKLDTTDGAHRRGQIEEILNSPKVAEDQKEALKRNAVDVKIVVLMDVDCIVSGDVAHVAEVAGDVGICAIARSMEGRKGTRHWLAFETSSRVIVFNPTDAARSFAQRWAAKIAASDFSHDEWALSWAFLSSPDVRFDYIDQRYSGREVTLMPDAVIAHDSAHERQKRAERGGIRDLLRAIELPFRTGRTKARKLRGEMSVLVKAG